MNNKAGIVILTENHLLKEELVNKIRSNDHYEIIAMKLLQLLMMVVYVKTI